MVHVIRGDIKEYAGFCRLLADENRLQILFSLDGGQKSVSSIIEGTQLSQTLVSYHLRTLREHGLVKTERRGPFVLYSLIHESLLAWISDTSRFVIVGKQKSMEGQQATAKACYKRKKPGIPEAN
ncbi:ArsR family transcriptional regulator [Alicyclobacillaceae bacterium I2511]|nr:ArsR family transcriptional regulator [Alicyclobacillaceae bacterium I2511]